MPNMRPAREARHPAFVSWVVSAVLFVVGVILGPTGHGQLCVLLILASIVTAVVVSVSRPGGGGRPAPASAGRSRRLGVSAGLLIFVGSMFCVPYYILTRNHVGKFGQPTDIGGGLVLLMGYVVIFAGVVRGVFAVIEVVPIAGTARANALIAPCADGAAARHLRMSSIIRLT